MVSRFLNYGTDVIHCAIYAYAEGLHQAYAHGLKSISLHESSRATRHVVAAATALYSVIIEALAVGFLLISVVCT